MIEFGTSSIPNIATTKTVPLKSTARLAVAPEASIASELAAAVTALLAVARDDEQRVVDPEREPHAGEHVHEEDRELELLGEDRAQPERDEDRDERHQQRDQAGDDGAEHEQEDDQRGGKAELELALLEVLLREEVEVVVERLLAGDRDGERVVLGRLLDGCDDVARFVLAEDLERDDRRMPIFARRALPRRRGRCEPRPGAVARSPTRSCGRRSTNSSESTVCSSERMTSMSLTASPGRGGNAANRTRSARSDSGSFVGAPSVVRLPPSRVAIATTARTRTTIQAPIVRHG